MRNFSIILYHNNRVGEVYYWDSTPIFIMSYWDYAKTRWGRDMQKFLSGIEGVYESPTGVTYFKYTEEQVVQERNR